MIIQDNKNRIFTLQTRNTTYQMKADPKGVLLHTYYGPRIAGGDLSRLIRYADRGFSPNPDEAGEDRTYSLDTLPQEYSGAGAGDFRLPSLELELPDGSHVAQLRFAGAEVRRGKYALEGLPAFFSREDGADTLAVTLEDPVARVRVELLYGVFEDCDLITRAARIVNCGEEAVRLRRAASLCLDFPDAGMDFVTFDGGHVKERGLNRAPLRRACSPWAASGASPATSTTLSLCCVSPPLMRTTAPATAVPWCTAETSRPPRSAASLRTSG